MKLYVDKRLTSPYALSVFVALTEKRIPFVLEYVELETGGQNDKDFVALSRTRRVPTLVAEHFAISESSAITEYLEDTCPDPAIYPKNNVEKAIARQVQAWLRSDLMPIREERSTEGIFYPSAVKALSNAAAASADKLISAAESLVAPGHDNLFGEWCIADVDLALMLNRLLHNGDSLPPRLAEYVRRQWSRPSLQEWVKLPRPNNTTV